MDREFYAWLYDVLNSIEEIEIFIPASQRIFEEYKKDVKTRRAIERNL